MAVGTSLQKEHARHVVRNYLFLELMLRFMTEQEVETCKRSVNYHMHRARAQDKRYQ